MTGRFSYSCISHGIGHIALDGPGGALLSGRDCLPFSLLCQHSTSTSSLVLHSHDTRSNTLQQARTPTLSHHHRRSYRLLSLPAYMATQPDLVDPEQEGEHEHQMFEAYQTQDQSLGNQQDRLFPPQTYEQDQLGQRTVPRHPLEDAMPSSSPHPGPAAASADFMPIMDAGSDAFDADMLSGLDVLRRPPPPEAKQSTDNPDWVPLLQAEVARPDLMYDRNPSDQEGAAMEATLARDANLTNVSHEQHLQGQSHFPPCSVAQSNVFGRLSI